MNSHKESKRVAGPEVTFEMKQLSPILVVEALLHIKRLTITVLQ